MIHYKTNKESDHPYEPVVLENEIIYCSACYMPPFIILVLSLSTQIPMSYGDGMFLLISIIASTKSICMTKKSVQIEKEQKRRCYKYGIPYRGTNPFNKLGYYIPILLISWSVISIDARLRNYEIEEIVLPFIVVVVIVIMMWYLNQNKIKQDEWFLNESMKAKAKKEDPVKTNVNSDSVEDSDFEVCQYCGINLDAPQKIAVISGKKHCRNCGTQLK